jgi:Domain of unknown function (DUF4381)
LRELHATEAALREGQAPATAAAEISAILKRAALVAFPREASAELTGGRWASFLDRTGRAKDFTDGAGKDLWLVAYGAPSSSADMKGIVRAARRWLHRHRAREEVGTC